MSKELPYFRFTASEWLNDDISLESYQLKGVFIDVCAFYWFRDCSVDIALLDKKFSNASDELHELRELGIIKYNTDDSITIKFLDEQFDLLSEKRKKRMEAGRIGGKRKASNAKAMLKQKPSYKDKDNDKDKYKDNKKPKAFNFKKSIIDLGVSESVCDDWLKVRKTKKATNTQTAFEAIKKQIEISGATAQECIEMAVVKSWAGFKAEWYLNEIKINKNEVNKKTYVNRDKKPDFKTINV